jgi:hypothetical protein
MVRASALSMMGQPGPDCRRPHKHAVGSEVVRFLAEHEPIASINQDDLPTEFAPVPQGGPPGVDAEVLADRPPPRSGLSSASESRMTPESSPL